MICFEATSQLQFACSLSLSCRVEIICVPIQSISNETYLIWSTLNWFHLVILIPIVFSKKSIQAYFSVVICPINVSSRNAQICPPVHLLSSSKGLPHPCIFSFCFNFFLKVLCLPLPSFSNYHPHFFLYRFHRIRPICHTFRCVQLIRAPKQVGDRQ